MTTVTRLGSGTNGTTGTSVAATLSSGTSGGGSVVVSVVAGNQATATTVLTGISDNSGNSNTYVLDKAAVNSSSEGAWIYRIQNPNLPSGTVVTATFSSTMDHGMCIAVDQASDILGTPDVTNSAAFTSSTTTPSIATTVTASDILVLALLMLDGSGTITVGGSSYASSGNVTPASGCQMSPAYWGTPTSGSSTASWTLGSAHSCELVSAGWILGSKSITAAPTTTATITAAATRTKGGSAAVTATATVTAAAGGTFGVRTSQTATATIAAVAKLIKTPFPGGALDLQAELNLAGTWTNITSYIYQRAPVTITRGRQDEATACNPSQATCQLNNRDGRFTYRNPAGPYYGQLTRNTPIRFSIPASQMYLRLEDDAVSYISAPDSAGLSPTGSIELQLDMKLSSYAAAVLASKDDAASQRSWSLRLNGDGTIALYAYDSGSTEFITTSTLPLPLGRIALKVTLDTTTGTVTFYTAPTIAGSWTQLGNAVTGSASAVFDSTSAVSIGYSSAITGLGTGFAGPAGAIYAFRLLNGIGGTTVASPDFTTSTAGAASLTDVQGNVWTLAGTAAFSGRDYRFHGELAALPQQWDPAGKDVWTPLTAAGLLRRLGQGTAPVLSSLRRAFLQAAGTSAPLGYWPCEDSAKSTSFASALSGGTPMTIIGTPTLATDTSFACSAALPALNGSTWTGVPAAASGTPSANSLKFTMLIPSGGEPDGTVIASIYTTGKVARYDMLYTAASSSVTLKTYNSSNSLLSSTALASVVAGRNLLVEMLLIASGGNITYTAGWFDQAVPSPGTTGGGGSAGAGSIGQITRFVINPGGGLTSTVIGHVMAGQSDDVKKYENPFLAWLGETAGNRFYRLCTENGIGVRIYGYPSTSGAMGYQAVDTLANLLQACEDVDRGMLFESRSSLSLGYRTLSGLVNQAAAVTLDYSAAELVPPLAPTDDDQFTHNDVTVTRSGGSSARQTLTSGALSTAAPPAGVGTYDQAVTVTAAYDWQLNDIAGWILSIGTVDQERYPTVTVSLIRPEVTTLLASLPAVDVGDYVSISNPPAWLPPGPIAQLAAGMTETMNRYQYDIEWNCVPELPYTVGALGSGATTDYRWDTDGSTLHAGITSAAASMQADTTNGASPLWTTDPADCPFDIVMGGEQITVTAVTGTSSPQTFTITRSVNGVVKAHTAGESIVVAKPLIWALV